jgi:hypothetical protein
MKGCLTVGKSTLPTPFVEAPPASQNIQAFENRGKPLWPMTCFPCRVTQVPPFLLPSAPLGQMQRREPAASPDSNSGKAFQRELEGAARESVGSAPKRPQRQTGEFAAHPGLDTTSQGTAATKRDEPRLGTDSQSGPGEPPPPAPAVAQPARSEQVPAEAKAAGADGTVERTDPVVALESGAQSRCEENRSESGGKVADKPPTGPVLERTSLPAAAAGDVAFGVKCSEAAPAASATGSMPAAGESDETTGSRVPAGALQLKNVAEPATSSGKLPAGTPALPEAAVPVASAGRENSAGTGNPPPGSGSAEQGDSPGPGNLPRKLTDAALQEDGSPKADRMSGKPSNPPAGSGPGSAGAETGNIQAAVPPPLQAAHAASNGLVNVPAHHSAPESGTIQLPAEIPGPGAAPSVGRIDLRVHGQHNERVDVRLVARRNEVQVTVKTESPGLTTKLRGGLQELVQTLKDSGFQTEAWRPLPTGSPSSSANNDTGAEQERTPEGGKGGRESASGWQQENRGGRGRQDDPPRWVEELEASSASSPRTNWRELSWQR